MEVDLKLRQNVSIEVKTVTVNDLDQGKQCVGAYKNNAFLFQDDPAWKQIPLEDIPYFLQILKD